MVEASFLVVLEASLLQTNACFSPHIDAPRFLFLQDDLPLLLYFRDVRSSLRRERDSLPGFFGLPAMSNVHTDAHHPYRFACFIGKNLALDPHHANCAIG
jgi:hypothetical protein